MIVEGLIDALVWLVALLIDIMPSFQIFDDLSVVTQIVSWFAWANYYIPLEDFVGAALSVLGVWVLCSTFSVIITLL